MLMGHALLDIGEFQIFLGQKDLSSRTYAKFSIAVRLEVSGKPLPKALSDISQRFTYKILLFTVEKTITTAPVQHANSPMATPVMATALQMEQVPSTFLGHFLGTLLTAVLASTNALSPIP
jgi:hypothetical protein